MRWLARLEIDHIRSETLENDSAADRAGWPRSCQCPPVCLVESTESDVKTAYQESVGRNALVSHETRGAPTIERSRETFWCEGNAAGSWRESLRAESRRCFRVSLRARLHLKAGEPSCWRASPSPNQAVCWVG